MKLPRFLYFPSCAIAVCGGLGFAAEPPLVLAIFDVRSHPMFGAVVAPISSTIAGGEAARLVNEGFEPVRRIASSRGRGRLAPMLVQRSPAGEPGTVSYDNIRLEPR